MSGEEECGRVWEECGRALGGLWEEVEEDLVRSRIRPSEPTEGIVREGVREEGVDNAPTVPAVRTAASVGCGRLAMLREGWATRFCGGKHGRSAT